MRFAKKLVNGNMKRLSIDIAVQDMFCDQNVQKYCYLRRWYLLVLVRRSGMSQFRKWITMSYQYNLAVVGTFTRRRFHSHFWQSKQALYIISINRWTNSLLCKIRKTCCTAHCRHNCKTYFESRSQKSNLVQFGSLLFGLRGQSYFVASNLALFYVIGINRPKEKFNRKLGYKLCWTILIAMPLQFTFQPMWFKIKQ